MKIEIKENCSYKTVLDILKYEFKLPSSIITFLKKKDRGIVLNGERVTVRKTVNVGDLLELEYTDEKTAIEESNILPVKLPLDIIYEDSELIAVNKPPYMPTHPSHNHYDDTLANALRYYFDSKDIPFIFRSVNRLDNLTSGIVLVAKNKLSAARLSENIAKGRVFKGYIAVLHGSPEVLEGEICAPIRRTEKSIITRSVCDDGAQAITRYKILYKNDMFSLVKAIPITGRTHQLRVHFAHIGHPICGDTLYGYPSRFIARQALHAYETTFTHPTSEEVIRLTSFPPRDIISLCNEVFDPSEFNLERILNND